MTFSIVGRCERTGMVGVAIASLLAASLRMPGEVAVQVDLESALFRRQLDPLGQRARQVRGFSPVLFRVQGFRQPCPSSYP
jgi:hypothetical protein